MKAVIFDLDGTLIDTRERFFRLFNETLESFSLPQITRKTFEELYSKAALDDVIPENLRKTFWRHFLVRYGETSSNSDAPIPGIEETLKELREKGLLVCVVTGRVCSSQSVWSELEKHGLAKYIDVVCAKNQNVKDYYSKEEELLRALGEIGVKPNECVVVGDYLADVEAGKKVGAFTVAVLSGGVKREVLELVKPDAILESARELPKLLNLIDSPLK
ncbi:MAG: HAD family hydrolase [Candidatus Jordarchaeales archaeon]